MTTLSRRRPVFEHVESGGLRRGLGGCQAGLGRRCGLVWRLSGRVLRLQEVPDRALRDPRHVGVGACAKLRVAVPRAHATSRNHENSCQFSCPRFGGRKPRGSQTASQSPSACHSQLINQFSAITCRARAARQTDEPLLDRSTRGRPTDHRQAHVSASDSYGGSRQSPGRAAPTPSTIDADRPSRRS